MRWINWFLIVSKLFSFFPNVSVFSRSSLPEKVIYFLLNTTDWSEGDCALTFCSLQALREYTKPIELEPEKNKTKWNTKAQYKTVAHWEFRNRGRHMDIFRCSQEKVLASEGKKRDRFNLQRFELLPHIPQLFNGLAQIPRPVPTRIGGGRGRPRVYDNGIKRCIFINKNLCCTDLLSSVLHPINHVFFNHSF